MTQTDTPRFAARQSLARFKGRRTEAIASTTRRSTRKKARLALSPSSSGTIISVAQLERRGCAPEPATVRGAGSRARRDPCPQSNPCQPKNAEVTAG